MSLKVCFQYQFIYITAKCKGLMVLGQVTNHLEKNKLDTSPLTPKEIPLESET